MIINLLNYQAAYYEKITKRLPLDTEENQISTLLNPASSRSSSSSLSTGFRGLYDRFIPVKRSEQFQTPADEVYKKNLQTLWVNTKRLKSALDEMESKYSSQMNECQNHIEQEYKEIEKQVEATATQHLVRKGDYVCGNRSVPAYAVETRYKHVHVGSWHFNYIEQCQAKIQKLQKEKEISRARAVWSELGSLVHSALEEGSFLLVHDIITLIDEGALYPMDLIDEKALPIVMENRLKVMRARLNCRNFVKKNIDNLEYVQQGCQAILDLEIYICSIMKKRQIWAYASEYFIEMQLRDFLKETLINDLQNTPLIQGLMKLLPEKASSGSVIGACRAHIEEGHGESVQTIMNLNLISTKDLNFYVFDQLFREALQDGNLEKAQFIYKLNGKKSPTNDYILSHLLEQVISNVEIVKFIVQIAGKIEERSMQEAIKMAKSCNYSATVEYLKQYDSSCVIS